MMNILDVEHNNKCSFIYHVDVFFSDYFCRIFIFAINSVLLMGFLMIFCGKSSKRRTSREWYPYFYIVTFFTQDSFCWSMASFWLWFANDFNVWCCCCCCSSLSPYAEHYLLISCSIFLCYDNFFYFSQVEYQVTANVYLLSFCYVLIWCVYYHIIIYLFVEHYSQHGCQQTNKNTNIKMKLSLKKLKRNVMYGSFIVVCCLIASFYIQMDVQMNYKSWDIIKRTFWKLSWK